MYKFSKEQKILEIGKLKIGGQPGERPTVLVGTIFYGGHKIVTEPTKGEFDKGTAESLLKRQEELSDLTGMPCMVQIFSESGEAICKYIDFVSKITDSPFLIDSTDANVRMSGVEYARDVGLIDRAVYNSVNTSITDNEIKRLKTIGVQNAIVLAFNVKDTSVKGKVNLLIDGAGVTQKGLLDIAKDCGVKNMLIDVAITPIGSGAGSAVLSTYVMKSKFGLPAGSGIHNAVSAWTWLKKLKKQIPEGKEMFRFCDVASNVVQIVVGGDYVLYGPIENAQMVFAVGAMADMFIAEATSAELGINTYEGHPIKKILG